MKKQINKVVALNFLLVLFILIAELIRVMEYNSFLKLEYCCNKQSYFNNSFIIIIVILGLNFISLKTKSLNTQTVLIRLMIVAAVFTLNFSYERYIKESNYRKVRNTLFHDPVIFWGEKDTHIIDKNNTVNSRETASEWFVLSGKIYYYLTIKNEIELFAPNQKELSKRNIRVLSDLSLKNVVLVTNLQIWTLIAFLIILIFKRQNPLK